MDVDGVLTSGVLPFDEHGSTIKHFSVQDGAALALWRRAGGRFALLSGRSSPAITIRAKELGAIESIQGAGEKLPLLKSLCDRCGVALADTSYIGDDWPDLAPMRACGYAVAVANAIPPIKRAASHVTRRPGGEGAVAEAVEHLMRRAGIWADTIAALEGAASSPASSETARNASLHQPGASR